MKRILLVTAGFFHPPLLGRRALIKNLTSLPGCVFRQAASLENLPADLESYAAMVLYIHQKEISDRALHQLDHFVASGGGLLGVHSATASFRQSQRYFEILGGRFSSHGPVSPFAITQAVGDTLFEKTPEFIVTDELYVHELQPGIQAHFSAQFQGQAIPVVWTYHWGQGKVCYATPGHTTTSMQHPSLQKILKQGLAWAAS